MKNRAILLVVFLCILAVDVAYGQGCSQCKLISEQSTEAGEASFATNINKGILILMSMPYILLLIVFRKRIVRFFKRLFKSELNSAN